MQCFYLCFELSFLWRIQTALRLSDVISFLVHQDIHRHPQSQVILVCSNWVFLCNTWYWWSHVQHEQETLPLHDSTKPFRCQWHGTDKLQPCANIWKPSVSTWTHPFGWVSNWTTISEYNRCFFQMSCHLHRQGWAHKGRSTPLSETMGCKNFPNECEQCLGLPPCW